MLSDRFAAKDLEIMLQQKSYCLLSAIPTLDRTGYFMDTNLQNLEIIQRHKKYERICNTVSGGLNQIHRMMPSYSSKKIEI